MNLNPDITRGNTDYEVAQIQVLEGLEAMRKRPNMYIGSTTSQGLHHMVYEIADNTVDETLAGHYARVGVSLNENDSITVRNSGRGIPTGVQKKTGLSAVQMVSAILHVESKFDNNSYKVFGGLHDIGASTVNALSCRLEAQVDQNGYSYVQSCARGVPLNQVHILCSRADQEHGTAITFWPGEKMFLDCSFDFRTLMLHLREAVFLANGLEVILYDKTCADDAGFNVCCFYCQNGLRDFISFMNDGQPTLYSGALYGQQGIGDIQAEFALIYDTPYGEELLNFASNTSTPEGDTHVSGFRQVPTRAINEYARKQGLLRECDSSLPRDELPEDMVATVNVRSEDPQFEGRTKQKLGSSSARPVIDRLVYEEVTLLLEQNPQVAEAILNKAALAKEARAAARGARGSARRKTTLAGLALPDKLAGCSGHDLRRCELFIVKGDSVGGSTKMARCREDQAALPLHDKALNVGETSPDKTCANTEARATISAFEIGIMDSFSLEGLRYHEIILVTDADVDGAHIITLLFTLLFRYIPKLIETGRVYLTQPLLYRVEKGKRLWYAYSDIELARILDSIGRDGTNKIQRYKKLGEMDANQLWETTMDPTHRIPLRASPEKSTDASDPVNETSRMFGTLMGDDMEPRRNCILEHTQCTIMLGV